MFLALMNMVPVMFMTLTIHIGLWVIQTQMVNGIIEPVTHR